VILAAVSLIFVNVAWADGLILGWDPNPEPDIAGYRLHYGTTSGNYAVIKDVGNTTTAVISDLVPGTTYYFSVSAYSTASLEGPLSDEVSTTYHPPPLDADSDGLPDAWESQYGISEMSNQTTGGAYGDPDEDGIPNLIEYAANTNPMVPNGPSPASVSIETNPADEKQYLTFSYRKRIGVPGITYVIQVSTTFNNWTPLEQPEQIRSVPAADGLTELVTVRIRPDLGSAPEKRWLRLGVTAGH
jgi:hypothetical protein